MADLASLVARLEAVATRLEGAGSSGGAAAASDGGSATGGASLDGFDEVLNGPLKTFMDLSNAVGGDVATQAALVEAAFKAQRAFLVVASESKQPAQADLPALLADTSKFIGEIQQFREDNRRSKQFNHLSMISEGIPALGWVAVAPKPCPFIKETADAATFYLNRVLKEFKDSDKQQADWAKSFGAIFAELHTYVKRVHTTGVVWNKNGKAAQAAAPAAVAPVKAAAPKAAAPKAAAGDGGGGGLFAALNKGGNVTSGLKKVDRSQMTHKNPELRASSVVSAGAVAPKKAPAKKFGGPVVKKDPVLELNGKKWQVEYQMDNPSLEIEANIKQTVYVYKCERSTLVVKGKTNAITVDGCKKFAIVFDSCMATFDMVNCASIQVQVINSVPTISIDKTDGAMVYLSATSLETQIVSAKSSEMNVLVPGPEGGDMIETPLPEQYKSTFENGKWITEQTDIAG